LLGSKNNIEKRESAMELLYLIGIVIALLLILVFFEKRPHRPKHATVNYLIPSKQAKPLTPREVFVAGINHMGICGEHRQKLISRLQVGEPIFLVRMPNDPYDSNAIILYSGDGKDIGFLPRELAAEIAPRLDHGSPVTASVIATEPFETESGQTLLGVRLRMIPHRMKRMSKAVGQN
jgi:hypothetical protein